MHSGLLGVARTLADDAGGGFPERRVAISAAYYALFNKLAAFCANALVGPPTEDRPERAWLEAYRNLSHAAAHKACEECVRRSERLDGFPHGIVVFSRYYPIAMRLRQRADYDPTFQPTRAQTVAHVAAVATAMNEVELVRVADRRAFAAFVHFAQGRRNIARSDG